MKKIYFLAVAMIASTSLFAQYDVQVNCTNPADGATVVGSAALNVDFTVTNAGPNAIPAGDTIWFSYAIGTDIYDLDGTPSAATGIILPATGFPVGQNITAAMLGGLVLDLSQMTAQSDICVICWGINGAIDLPSDPNDTDNTNNISCFTATPMPGAGIEENTISTSVYPNPANDVLNIVASEQIENVVILSLDGKVAATSTSSTVEVGNLTSGMYIYEVTTTSGKVSRDTFMKK